MSVQTVSARGSRIGRLLGQFVRFAVVGGSGVVVNMAVAVVMNKMHGGSANATRVMFPIPGTDLNFRFSSLVWIVSFLIANTYNYQLNRSWTFRGRGAAAADVVAPEPADGPAGAVDEAPQERV